jgi:outer membrane lipoprotein-sorting protein
MNMINEIVWLLYKARDNFTNVYAEFTYRFKPEIHRIACERYAAQKPKGSIGLWWRRFGLADIINALTHFKRTGGQTVNNKKETVCVWKIWLKRPSQWRSEQVYGQNRSIFIINGDWWFWWFYGSRRLELHTNRIPSAYKKRAKVLKTPVGITTDVEEAISKELWLDPSPLLAYHILEPIGKVTYLGREAIKVRALHKKPAHELFPEADDLEIWVDKERGVLLYYSAKFQGEIYAEAQVKEIIFDQHIDETVFSFPADVEGKLYLVKE